MTASRPKFHFCARFRRFQIRVLLGATFLLCAVAAQGSDPLLDIVRVEEDWEVVIVSPDETSTAPQITCAMSPVSNLEAAYATFELNHQTQPYFAPGGLHLQIWNQDVPTFTRSLPQNAVMSLAGETVRWTQVMDLNSGVLKFEIAAGESTTWGQFGTSGQLQASTQTSLTNLNGYTTLNSIENSGVGFAGNRVQSMSLKRVRYYTSGGTVLENTDVHVIATHE